MAAKQLERQFIGKMLRDLDWADLHVTDGDEPPDFLLIPPNGRDRIAVEVTRIYRRETAKGSPEAAQERTFETFVSALQEQYLRLPSRQLIQVTVVLPPVIRSSAVRRLTAAERREDSASGDCASTR